MILPKPKLPRPDEVVVGVELALELALFSKELSNGTVAVVVAGWDVDKPIPRLKPPAAETRHTIHD